MPDNTSILVTIGAVVLILAILGLIFLRILLVRFVYNLLISPGGRTGLAILMCIGGLSYAFSSSVQNHELVGGAIVGGGLLLLVITFGIPLLIKRWEKPSAAKESPFPRQTWPTSAPIAPPGIPNIPTPQPGAFPPMPTLPAPQPQGYWSPPTTPTQGPGGYFPPSTMPIPGPGGFLPRQYMPTPQPGGGAFPAPYMPPPMPTNMPPQSTPQSQGDGERSW
jgi:hypothetical protein